MQADSGDGRHETVVVLRAVRLNGRQWEIRIRTASKRAAVIDGLVVNSRVFQVSRVGLVTSRLATMGGVALAGSLIGTPT